MSLPKTTATPSPPFVPLPVDNDDLSNHPPIPSTSPTTPPQSPRLDPAPPLVNEPIQPVNPPSPPPKSPPPKSPTPPPNPPNCPPSPRKHPKAKNAKRARNSGLTDLANVPPVDGTPPILDGRRRSTRDRKQAVIDPHLVAGGQKSPKGRRSVTNSSPRLICHSSITTRHGWSFSADTENIAPPAKRPRLH